METFKAYLLIVGFVGVLGIGGYWAATSLNSPARIAETGEVKVVAQTPISTVVPTNSTESNTQTTSLDTSSQTNTDASQTTPTSTNQSHSDLITRLEKLISDNILMKEGSRGTRVGTVQEFLNVYNRTSGGIDNDYGAGTKTKVSAFQKAEGLVADGQAGPATYQKMIDWLNKQ